MNESRPISWPGRSDGLELSLIAAIARNGVIGIDGALPFRLRSDLRRFKRLTTGAPVIMGRKTHESIGRALPGRRNLVLSRQGSLQLAEGVERFDSLLAALGAVSDLLVDRCFVIGGASVYAESLPLASRLDLTWVDCDVAGDTYFPEFDLSHWRIVEESFVPRGEQDEYDSTYRCYRRQSDSRSEEARSEGAKA